jgi:CheY-like chemotaxis protein
MHAAPAKTILVVEDDDASREALRDLLVDEGYAVATALNGRLALEYLRGAPAPSLILLDLLMPEMDGDAFLGERKRDPALSAIPVILMSAGAGLVPPGLGVPVVPKPPDIDALLAAIERFAR